MPDILFYYSLEDRKRDENVSPEALAPSFSSNSEKLHRCNPGDSVWVFTWVPPHYRLVRRIIVKSKSRKAARSSDDSKREFLVEVDTSRSPHFEYHSGPSVDGLIIDILHEPPKAQSFRGKAHLRVLSSEESSWLIEFSKSLLGSFKHF
ncbi:MAG: hypothetical protein WC718_07070 [Phycisphaerales bacterium]